MLRIGDWDCGQLGMSGWFYIAEAKANFLLNFSKRVHNDLTLKIKGLELSGWATISSAASTSGVPAAR